jgi:hypothetical protein
MDYAKIQQPEDGAAEVREPAVAYAVGGWAAVEDEFDWDSIDGPEELKIRSFEDFKRKLDVGLVALKAGDVYTHEEVVREFRQKVKNGRI